MPFIRTPAVRCPFALVKTLTLFRTEMSLAFDAR